MQRHYWASFMMALALCVFFSAHAFATDLIDIRIKPLPYGAEVSLRLDGQSSNKFFTLPTPPRLVMDMPGTRWKAPTIRVPANPVIKAVRHGTFKQGELRLVFDLHQHAPIPHSHIARDSHGNQWVRFSLEGNATHIPTKPTSALNVKPIFKPTQPSANTPAPTATLNALDWTPVLKPTASEPVSQAELANQYPTPIFNPKRSAPKRVAAAPPNQTNAPIPVANPRRSYSLPVVVLDAGHGGIDPGAIGARNTKEKTITLRYAHMLKQGIEDTGRYRVKLIRDKDVFLRLRERIARARQLGGNIFISLHADSAPTKLARGFSVYTLSEEASDTEAAQLARQENRVDALGSMDLSSEPDDVASILIDLAQRDTQNKSSLLAEIMVAEYGKRLRLRKHTHRYAGFAVLKSADIPSVLLELGFLSNKEDESLLQTRAYEKKVLAGTIAALDLYLDAQHRTNPLHYSPK